jgi:hypothetical protein
VAQESEHPVTLGQLSVWRDIERMPPDRTWEGNLSVGWRVPPGISAHEVWAAVRALAQRHESLRTVYDLRTRRMRQRVLPVQDVMAAARRGEITVAERAKLEARELRHAFDLAAEPSWRAWLVLASGRPHEILVVIHHIAADGTATNVLGRDFQVLLAHGQLNPAPQPRQLAAQQHSEREVAALEAAEAYWRRTLVDAGSVTAPPVPRGEVVRADLHTGVPAEAAQQIAARLSVSLPSLLLAVYAQALASTFKLERLLLYPTSSNRFHPAYSDLVSSLNQWVPVLFDADERPFPQQAAGLHWRSFKALKYGCYNPDAIAAIQAELARNGLQLTPGWHFTFLPAPLDGRSATEWTAPSVKWIMPERSTGPSFYVVASTYPAVTLRVRVIRADFGREELAAFLGVMGDRISAVFSPGHRV